MLSGDIPFANSEHDPNEPARRRARRRIPELIVRELSFSGQAMTARQIAKAIDYNLEGTETALRRMEEAGQLHQSGSNRWTIASATAAKHLQSTLPTAATANSRHRERVTSRHDSVNLSGGHSAHWHPLCWHPLPVQKPKERTLIGPKEGAVWQEKRTYQVNSDWTGSMVINLNAPSRLIRFLRGS
jgi:hypothetical protein